MTEKSSRDSIKKNFKKKLFSNSTPCFNEVDNPETKWYFEAER